jgi:hypothetical protein
MCCVQRYRHRGRGVNTAGSFSELPVEGMPYDLMVHGRWSFHDASVFGRILDDLGVL